MVGEGDEGGEGAEGGSPGWTSDLRRNSEDGS